MKTSGKNYIYIKLFCAVVLLGVLCGITGTAFHWCIARVTIIRIENPLVFFLLPFAGLASVFIYKKLKVTGVGTMDVLQSINHDKPLPARVAAAVFGSSVITHLFGASCGKEGAALQIGSGIAVTLSKAFGLDESDRKMLTVCGMSALFSAVFGTPFAAAVFGVEVTCRESKALSRRCRWLIPCLVSSLISWGISSLFGTNAERFHIDIIPDFGAETLLRTLAVALACAAVTYIFYKGLHLGEHLALKLIRNGYLRIFLGGALIAALTVISGTTAFNGGGIEVINGIFLGEEAPFMGFLYKIVFTVISVASGFKGGEIVPTLYVGASLGSVLSGILGLPSAFASAVGMTGLFAGMTKCPIASLIISLEMYGLKGGAYFLAAVLVCTFLSGKGSLYIKNKR